MENKKWGFAQLLLYMGIFLNVALLVLSGVILYKVKIIKEEVKQIKAISLWQYGGDYKLAKTFFESEQFKKQAQEGIKQALKSIGVEVPWDTGASGQADSAQPQSEAAQVEVEEVKQKLQGLFPQGEFNGGVLSPEQLSEVFADIELKGNSNAPVVWLEYSDLECPFCARLHNQWTVKQVLDKYGDQIAYGLKHFPLGFHEKAFPAAQIMECTRDKLGKDMFYKLEEGTFASKDPSAENMYNLLKQYGATDQQIEDIKLCVQNGEYDEKIRANQAEWADVFGVRGTPGNVIIDTRTGKWILIPGAYPAQAFEIVVDSFLSGWEQ